MKHFFLKYKKSIIISTAFTLLPMLIGLVLWNQLPDQMTTHWGADGVADGFGGKGIVVFFLPILLAVMNLGCFAITGLDPKQRDQSPKALGMIFWIMPILSAVVFTMICLVNSGYENTVDVLLKAMPVFIGCTLIAIGNLMPKAKQNYTLGIKIRWTILNEENWNKTHRFAGKVWVICGILMIFLPLVPLKMFVPMLLADLFAIILIPMAYSYKIYAGHKAQGIEYKFDAENAPFKKASKISIVMVTLILIGVGVVMFTGDIDYTFDNDSLKISADYASDASVVYSDIDSIELKENFDVGVRTMGFASIKLSMGNFKNEELGNYTLYAYTSCDSMIVVHSNNQYLAFNTKTQEETKKLYDELIRK